MIRATVAIVGGREAVSEVLARALCAGEILTFHVVDQVDVEPGPDEIMASIRAQLDADNAADWHACELLDLVEDAGRLVETIVPVGGVL